MILIPTPTCVWNLFISEPPKTRSRALISKATLSVKNVSISKLIAPPYKKLSSEVIVAHQIKVLYPN